MMVTKMTKSDGKTTPMLLSPLRPGGGGGRDDPAGQDTSDSSHNYSRHRHCFCCWPPTVGALCAPTPMRHVCESIAYKAITFYR